MIEYLAPIDEMLKQVGPFLKNHSFHELVDAFDELTPKEKEILHALCDDDGVRVTTFADLARRINRSAGGVRAHYENGIRRIQSVLGFSLEFYDGKSGVLPPSFQKLADPAAAGKIETVSEKAKLEAELHILNETVRKLEETIRHGRMRRKALLGKCEELKERINELWREKEQERETLRAQRAAAVADRRE